MRLPLARSRSHKVTHIFPCRTRSSYLAAEIASYIAREQELLVPERYIHSNFSRDGKRVMFGVNSKLLIRIHKLRALDVDTTFKPVDGVFQIFEINGWMCSHNCGMFPCLCCMQA